MQKKFDPWLGKMPWKRKWQSTPVFSLHGKFHGQRSLEGYSPWGCKWLDTTWACTHEHQCISKAWVLVSHLINVACSWSPSRCKCMKMISCKQELPFPGRGIKTYPVTVQTMCCPFSLEQQVVDPHGLLLLVALSSKESQKRDGWGWG